MFGDHIVHVHVVCQSQEDMVLLSNVTRILELAVPLIEHPSETFLAQLEEDMMKLILKHGMMVIVQSFFWYTGTLRSVYIEYHHLHQCPVATCSILPAKDCACRAAGTN